MGRGSDYLYPYSKCNGKRFSKSVCASYLKIIFGNFLVSFSSFGSCGSPKNTNTGHLPMTWISKAFQKQTNHNFCNGKGFWRFVPLYYMQWEGVWAMGRGFMICGFIVNATGRGFVKKPLGLDLRPLKAGYGHDRVWYRPGRSQGFPKRP